MKISTKLGGGYILVLAMVLLCSGAGFYGVTKLSGLLDFITNQAWNTADGAMEGSMGIEAEMIGVGQIISGHSDNSSAIALVENGRNMANEALGRMINAGLMSDTEVQLITDQLSTQEQLQQDLLTSYKTFKNNDELLRTHFESFQNIMTLAEEVGDSSVESLESSPDTQLSWNTGLEEKWTAADGGMETQINLLTRFYNYQRLVGIMDPNKTADENAVLNRLDIALRDLETTSTEIIDHPLFKSTPVPTELSSEKALSSAISQAMKLHRSDFETAINSFKTFRSANHSYQQSSNKLLSTIGEIEESADAKVEGQMDLVSTTKTNTFIAIAIAMATGIATVVALILFVVIEIIHALRGMTVASQKIADGDLTVKMCGMGKRATTDELATLNFNMDRMSEKLHATLSEVSTTSSVLASQAEELSAISNETKESVLDQQEQTGHVATAINEITASSKEVAANTLKARDSANHANTIAIEGKKTVEETITEIKHVSAEVNKTAEIIGFLSEDSLKIGNVLNVIREIAEQTNLLALNAAIEAARAGEQGRGFAVVADEVRSLAQRTQESTSEIQQVVEGLQSRTNLAHEAMNNSQTTVDNSTKQAASAEVALHNILSEVQKIADQTDYIATAMTQNEAATEEINQGIVGIETQSEHTVDAVNQTAVSSNELASLASNLQTMVSKFKL